MPLKNNVKSSGSGRILYIVRHAEREDNINRHWKKLHPGMKEDNSPLSERGRVQAEELGKRFADIEFDHIFCSPFDRTVETATRIVGNKNIPLKVEPGLAEALYLCENPPGFEDPEKLKKKYPLVDTSYKPVFAPPMPREGYGDDACTPRLRKTLEGILERFNSGVFVFVGHGASIGALHEVLIDKWEYVGQATVSQFEELDNKPGKFKCILSSDASHLSDKSNLRPW
uniref:Phosphoglycerate mutase n=1 Tax=Acrobeloides nanus TaxID=290746 RepID=A0A914CJ21_9BILA